MSVSADFTMAMNGGGKRSLGLEALPAELLDFTIQHLDSESFQNLRLASNRLASITRPHLSLQTFHGLPWRDDTARLKALSRIPDCARRIRAVCFNLSQLDEYIAFHESLCNYALLEPEARNARLRDAWAEYFATQGLAKRAGPVKLGGLAAALGGLPSLRSVAFTWMRCPWRAAEPNRVFDSSNSIKKARRSMLEVHGGVLDALFALEEVRLRDFVLEPLMLNEVSTVSVRSWVTSRPFGSITMLKLAPRQTHEPGAMEKLELMLLALPGLRDLSLEFEPMEQRVGLSLSATYDELESLHLSAAVVNVTYLADFVSRHASTLRMLHLGELMGLSPSRSSSPNNNGAGSGPTVAAIDGPVMMTAWDYVFQQISTSCQLDAAHITGTFGLYDDTEMTSPHDTEPLRFAEFMVPRAVIGDYLVRGGAYPEDTWDLMLP